MAKKHHPVYTASIIIMILYLFRMDSSAQSGYLWLRDTLPRESVLRRIPAPSGYERISATKGTFAVWLRHLPLRRHGVPVRLFNGQTKRFQDGAFAVIDIDVGSTDLQQCADAVIRLRAEYLFAAGCTDRIVFNFTSGHPARWTDWSSGQRPSVSGNRVTWTRRASPDSSRSCFRNYLNSVFTYAGSHSLSRELKKVEDPADILPGDVFIQGGFPGHAVIVIDVAQNGRGQKVFLLAQSYMPAQDIHILNNPGSRGSPWYSAQREGQLVTPEWTFSRSDLKRFAQTDCGRRDVRTVPVRESSLPVR
jgi:hypothetical protein